MKVSKTMAKGGRGNGEGNIKKRSNGTYEARVTVEGNKRLSIYGKSRKEVQEKLKIVLREQGGNVVMDPERTVRDRTA